jgi:hypothetical protein
MELTMKTTIIALILLASTLCFADKNGETKNKSIEEIKANSAARMDKRISLLQTAKSCIQGASSKDAIKACRKSKREAMKAIKGKHKGRKGKHKH